METGASTGSSVALANVRWAWRLVLPPATRSTGLIRVRLGRSAQTFEDHVVTKAIYATTWDGTVVMEAGADGAWRQVAADVEAAE